MNAFFYTAAAVAVAGAALAVSSRHAVHALLCLLAGLLGLALAIFALGAPFAAALEVIIYAGAIMMLFVFVVMMISFSRESAQRERAWQPGSRWIAPVVLGLVLMVEWVAVLRRAPSETAGGASLGPAAVGAALFNFYVLGVELASMLLLAGLIGACHLARKGRPRAERSDP